MQQFFINWLRFIIYLNMLVIATIDQPLETIPTKTARKIHVAAT